MLDGRGAVEVEVEVQIWLLASSFWSVLAVGPETARRRQARASPAASKELARSVQDERSHSEEMIAAQQFIHAKQH